MRTKEEKGSTLKHKFKPILWQQIGEFLESVSTGSDPMITKKAKTELSKIFGVDAPDSKFLKFLLKKSWYSKNVDLSDAKVFIPKINEILRQDNRKNWWDMDFDKLYAEYKEWLGNRGRKNTVAEELVQTLQANPTYHSLFEMIDNIKTKQSKLKDISGINAALKHITKLPIEDKDMLQQYLIQKTVLSVKNKSLDDIIFYGMALQETEANWWDDKKFTINAELKSKCKREIMSKNKVNATELVDVAKNYMIEKIWTSFRPYTFHRIRDVFVLAGVWTIEDFNTLPEILESADKFVIEKAWVNGNLNKYNFETSRDTVVKLWLRTKEYYNALEEVNNRFDAYVKDAALASDVKAYVARRDEATTLLWKDIQYYNSFTVVETAFEWYIAEVAWDPRAYKYRRDEVVSAWFHNIDYYNQLDVVKKKFAEYIEYIGKEDRGPREVRENEVKDLWIDLTTLGIPISLRNRINT